MSVDWRQAVLTRYFHSKEEASETCILAFGVRTLWRVLCKLIKCYGKEATPTVFAGLSLSFSPRPRT
jgi:hypothetical protein